MGIPARTRVTLTPDGSGGRRREFCLRRPLALLLGALVLLTWIGAAMLVAGALQCRSQRTTIAELERQLAAARTEALTARVLKAELEQTRRLQDDLLAMVGLARTDSLGGALPDTLCDLPAGLVTALPGAEEIAGAGPGAATASDIGDTAAANDPGVPPSRWPAAGTIVREFVRGDPARGIEPYRGVDIAGTEGARVVAVAPGDVDFVGEDDVLGRYLEIRHGLDWVTIYGHCSAINVGPGHRVRAGEQVAKMGRGGQASAAQVHFEVWYRGEAVDPRQHISGEPAPR